MKPHPADICGQPRTHTEKRDAIVRAAADVFCREGFAGTNVDLVAAEAGVSRQTIYNHHGDKESLFAAVVRDITERCNAGFFEVLSTFPDHPQDLERELVEFGVRLNRNCICSRDGKFLRKLIQAEGERYPRLFAEWRENGPAKTWSALAARLARLALASYLDIDDPDLAARQFVALNSAELQAAMTFGEHVDEAGLRAASAAAVRTFLRAYGRRG